MASQTEILGVLVPRSAVKVDEIIAALQRRGANANRKKVFIALGRLMKRRFVATASMGGTRVYSITHAGRDFKRTGKEIVGSAPAHYTGVRPIDQASFRARLWRAFRMKQKASLPELIELAREPRVDGSNVTNNARDWMNGLIVAGVAAKLRTRDAGHAPTSNGFIRYALLKDLGPLAPSVRKTGLHDFNAGALIPFPKEGAAP